MKRSCVIGFVLITVLWLVGCETTGAIDDRTHLPVHKLLQKKGVVNVPFERTELGLFLIPIQTEYGTQRFLIDTGATRSAIFKDSDNQLLLQAEPAGVANILGLVNSGYHPMVKVAELKLGRKVFRDWLIAILPERELSDTQVLSEMPVGIIGMDIMEAFNVYVDAQSKTMSFIPHKLPSPVFSSRWTPVNLYHNPNTDFDKGLHFFDLRVGNHLMPAILDSGAEFNVLNWEASVIPELRRLKRRMRNDWEIQGAIGEFDPAVRINVNGMRAGQKRWKKNEFVVMNFNHMDPLGFQDQPLVVAGSNIFGDESFYINFETNKIWFDEPKDLKDIRTGENTESITFDRR